MMRLARSRHHQGLSLLELLVAFSIMALALGMLYRVTGGSLRGVASIDTSLRASTVAESLLSRDSVPPGGWMESGETAGYAWEVRSEPYPTAVTAPTVPRLYEVVVVVHWRDSSGPRQMEWVTLRPERKPLEGEVVR